VNLETQPGHAPLGADTDYHVGVEVGATVIRAGVFSKTLRLIGKTKLSAKLERGPEAVIARIARCILYTADECDLSVAQIKAVGVGVPGRIESPAGAVVHSTDLGWTNVPFRNELRRLLPCPVHVANCHNLATFGIYSQELAEPPRSFAAIFLGPQIAGGLIVGNQIQELLVNRTPDEGLEDPGQNIFCTLPRPEFRAFRSRDFRKALRKGRDIPAVRQFLLEIADRAGGVAADLVTRFQPEVIALGGGVMDELGNEILTAVCESARAKLGCDLADRTVLMTSALGDLAGITGAAAWAVRHNRAQPAAESVALDTVH
jgi:glucokinase